MAAVRDLCWRYRQHLLTHAGARPVLTQTLYPKPEYAALLERLSELHAAPDGTLLLATLHGNAIACGMYRRFDAESCEIKRVYVDSACRGMGVARSLMLELLRRARTAGYSSALLDTMKTLDAARALYARLGFRERGPYADVPDIARDRLCFFEYDLTAD